MGVSVVKFGMPITFTGKVRNYREYLLNAMVESTTLADVSYAETYEEYLLERLAGITDIKTIFTEKPKNTKEQLYYAILNNEAFSGILKSDIEILLNKRLLNETVTIPESSYDYEEWLIATAIISGKLGATTLLKIYGFPYSDDYSFSSWLDYETRNLILNTSNFDDWTNAAIGAYHSTVDGIRFYEFEDDDAASNENTRIDLAGVGSQDYTVSWNVLKEAGYSDGSAVFRLWSTSAGGASFVEFSINQEDGSYTSRVTGSALPAISFETSEDLGDYVKYTLSVSMNDSVATVHRLYIYPSLRPTNDDLDGSVDVASVGRVRLGGVTVINKLSTGQLATINTSGKQILIDSSGKDNDGYLGSVRSSGIVYDGERGAFVNWNDSDSSIYTADTTGLVDHDNFWVWAEVNISPEGLTSSSEMVTLFRNGANSNFRFRVNTVSAVLNLFDSNANPYALVSNFPTEFVDNGYKGFLGVEYKNDVAGDSVAEFYYKLNASDAWVSFGTDTMTTITLQDANNAPFKIGSRGAVGASVIGFGGRIYQVNYGSGDWLSTLLVDVDFDSTDLHGAIKILDSVSSREFLLESPDGSDSSDLGWSDEGLVADGDDYAIIPDLELPADDYCVTILIYISAIGTGSKWIWCESSATASETRGELLVTNSGVFLFRGYENAGAEGRNAGTAAATAGDEWVVISCVRDSEGIKIFKNGSLADSNNFTYLNDAVSAGEITLGARSDGGAQLESGSKIGGFHVLPQSVVAADVLAQYNGIKSYLTAKGLTDILADLP